jgi:hypothetical protein
MPHHLSSVEMRGQELAPASKRVLVTPAYNLVILHEPDVQDWGDLEAIAREVRKIASDIEVFLASNDLRSSTTRKWAARRPCLIYCPTVLRSFQPLRGKVYAGALIPKDVQARRLVEAGVPVPEFVVLSGDFPVDPERFGPVIMLKPTGFTSHGRGAAMVRRATLDGPRWQEHPLVRSTTDGPMIAQKFIDTGEYPSHYRVLTFFGEPIFAFRAVSTVPRPSLNAPDEELAAGPFMAKHGQRMLIVPVEEDVLDLARACFRALPEVALHGCDIIREAGTGKLYVLETNPGGNTWSFSSQWAALLRRELNMPDLSAQFDAWRVCARLLVDRTRQEAE